MRPAYFFVKQWEFIMMTDVSYWTLSLIIKLIILFLQYVKWESNTRVIKIVQYYTRSSNCVSFISNTRFFIVASHVLLMFTWIRVSITQLTYECISYREICGWIPHPCCIESMWISSESSCPNFVIKEEI